jgi:hypothetical protein
MPNGFGKNGKSKSGCHKVKGKYNWIWQIKLLKQQIK